MSSETTLEGLSGREASRKRRQMLSHGKAALPKASERVRTGFRDAALPDEGKSAPAAAPSKPAADAVPSQSVPSQSEPQQVAVPQSVTVPSGRKASMERRRALSQGKIGIKSAHERLRRDSRDTSSAMASAPSQLAPSQPEPAPMKMPEGGRAASVARRRALSQGKAALPGAKERVRTGFRDAALPKDASPRRAQPAASAQPAPSAPSAPRQGSLKYPPKVASISTALSQSTVTGFSQAQGRAVTGAEAGRDKPLTGTQYVTGEEGGYRPSLGKVGHARTEGGMTVSGTMVRSTVRITGDEDSAEARITGNADQKPADDLGGRSDGFIAVGAQFARQTQPHGHSVFGTNLGHSAGSVGSRSRETERPVEQTLSGHAVSGTAIGRSVRVTGDENGAQRGLTGTQYLAPSGHQATQAPQGGRADPATGTKVSASQTWGGQTVTGPQMEHNAHVTGSEHGTCQTLTGTPYYGASGTEAWCGAESAAPEAVLRGRCTPPAVTGDVPMHDPSVSGTHRGADRTITGSAYFVSAETRRDGTGDPVAQSITGFSIGSPQRMAHLAARAAEPQDQQRGRDASAITGTFAQGEGKITGNVEFAAGPRKSRGAAAPARRGLTGEGAVSGAQITGSAWSDNPRVTGTEDYIASGRNPSTSGEHAAGFAGARRFKSDTPAPERTSKVTGAVGGAGSRAAVTLSGGAAG